MRLKAIIRYDGTFFSGYQVQPNGRTVQGVMEKVLMKMHKGNHVRVTASGRTDQGVHAVGQVIHFDTELEIPPENWLRALNTMLPDDVEVISITDVPENFHARYDVSEKEYRYYILNAKEKDLFRRHYTHFVKEKLDLGAMSEASQHFLGSHDFSSFCAANSKVKGDKVREITDIAVDQDGENMIVRVKGTGFLYNMVRIIVGTMIEIGLGKRESEEITEIIAAQDRSKAGKTAPPQGLYLWEVNYNKKS
ncbi:tRNA pseudouridine(38-40) synthase TruA [Gracilibacillus salitolerans]|uniref:tRNA pseudouridine synthase A n=1 Tax=Gracilibacillus salitolerans TaxID=2663022 RepID=A0A5Q2TDD8_9BACI|nr:tRNA pseudouridine(38-40) synthase TruA [Gracilibacillus salitolerans]QGH32749.1 tRNA pseudouridine(38-40) synthase TruA [Gracilibacillus salitolerans]